ncbi:tRNA synthetases class I-domain-containing protein [Mycena sp. CBHHK59/15]|nr:tRNA synthetases class I-domain-containing protein [Mycena sp. CBHHK59/15]
MSTVATPPGDVPNPNSKSAVSSQTAKIVASTGDKKVKEKEKKDVDPPFVNTTPKGRRKARMRIDQRSCAKCRPDLSQPMASGYNPIAEQGFFAPQFTADGKIKPEGALHIGHGLTTAIQDSLVRWNRMLGKTTLFAPGFDHAGISTQSVVEKRLYKSSGRTRHDLGRERFVETVMDWKNDYQARITNQLHRLGGSYDWNRVVFTMDEKRNKAVIETFCRLHEDGVIYRANRLVQWCVKMNTPFPTSRQVDQKQLTGRTMLTVPGYDPKERFEFGVIVSFAYQIENSDEKIIVATTRPETMLGDTAIAVHSDDPRYKVDSAHPIVTDDIIVDMEFGTGAVKITPAHDPNDYEVGVRHKLDFINILNDDGTFNANAGETFKGMKRFHARVAVVKALKDAGLYIETKDNPMEIPYAGFKSGDIVEPVLKPQWWVSCKPLAEEAIKRTRAGELVITPKQSENDWYRWLDNIQDWCISRQLWWGHRCPAYLVNVEGADLDRKDGKYWVVGRTLEEAMERAKALAGDKKFVLEQDEDVLDTWFSSGLWPFSIMGWPENTADFEKFYPATLLETGWDILFFWVARMVLLGIRLTGKVPFNEMSKSLGNVLHEKLKEGNLDEKEIVKATAGQKKDFPNGIPQCGTDALRFALCAYSGGGYRKFCNKIFNATKFAMLKWTSPLFLNPLPKYPTGNESLVEQWILHKLNLCDVYIEVMKPMTDEAAPLATRKSAQQTLYTCLDHGLRLLHPFMPFVTEELWQRLPRRPNDTTPSIMVSYFPVFDKAHVFETADQHFNLVFSALKTGRSLAASYNLQSDIQLFFYVQSDQEAALFESQLSTIVALTKGCKSAKLVREPKDIPEGCGGAVVTPTVAVHTLVRGLVDLDVEIAKCDKKLDLSRMNLQKLIKVETQPDYEDTVPANVRLANEEKRKTIAAEIVIVELSKSMFVKLK